MHSRSNGGGRYPDFRIHAVLQTANSKMLSIRSIAISTSKVLSARSGAAQRVVCRTSRVHKAGLERSYCGQAQSLLLSSEGSGETLQFGVVVTCPESPDLS